MASSSESEDDIGMMRPLDIPDLDSSDMMQSMRAHASSTAKPSSSVKLRVAALQKEVAAHVTVSAAVDPHLTQLEHEMEQLSAILEHKYTRTRESTMERLEEFRIESEYKFATAASEKKKFDNSVVQTQALLQSDNERLAHLEAKRVPLLEAELEVGEEAVEAKE